MSIAEISFVPAKLGSLPAQGGVPGTGMTDQDQEGWSQGGVNQRCKVVADPLGSKRLAFRFDLLHTDDADHWGGCRTEYWNRDAAGRLMPGMESWHVFSWLFPVGFSLNAPWALGFQIHGDDTESPPQSVAIQGGKLSYINQDHPESQSYGSAFATVPLTLGQEIFFAIRCIHAKDNSGLVSYWHSLAPVDINTQLPNYHHEGTPTISGGYSWTKIGLYSSPSGWTNPVSAFLYSLGRASTFARAAELAGWKPASTPPPPPPPHGPLDPKITKEANGNLTLRWTKDPQAKGYLITTPSGSATAGGNRVSSNLGKHDAISVSISSLYAQAAETVSYP